MLISVWSANSMSAGLPESRPRSHTRRCRSPERSSRRRSCRRGGLPTRRRTARASGTRRWSTRCAECPSRRGCGGERSTGSRTPRSHRRQGRRVVEGLNTRVADVDAHSGRHRDTVPVEEHVEVRVPVDLQLLAKPGSKPAARVRSRGSGGAGHSGGGPDAGLASSAVASSVASSPPHAAAATTTARSSATSLLIDRWVPPRLPSGTAANGLLAERPLPRPERLRVRGHQGRGRWLPTR